jgi:hypothetical protein
VALLAEAGPNGAVAAFTADGGLYELSADGFQHGGIFDPKQGVTRVWIGPAGTEPHGDPRTAPPT